MRIIDNKRVRKWYKLFEIRNVDSGWDFDSFRISGNTSKIEVAIAAKNNLPPSLRTGRDSYGDYIYGSGFNDVQKFSVSGEQHDFKLNFNGLDYSFYISGLADSNNIIEVAKNTSEGTFSDINMWIPNNGIYAEKLELKNQNLSSTGLWFGLYDSYNIYTQSTYVDISNSRRCEPNDIDAIIININNAGNSNGTLIYTGINFNGTPTYPTNESRAAYDSLTSKGWTITGTAPPTS